MDDQIILWVCVDCLYCTHGIADENPDTAKHVPAYAAAIEDVSRLNSGVEVFAIPSASVHECYGDNDFIADDCDCEVVTFSWNRCELCNSALGGTRHAITLVLDPVILVD